MKTYFLKYEWVYKTDDGKDAVYRQNFLLEGSDATTVSIEAGRRLEELSPEKHQEFVLVDIHQVL